MNEVTEAFVVKREAMVLIGAIGRRIRETPSATEADLTEWLKEISRTLAKTGVV